MIGRDCLDMSENIVSGKTEKKRGRKPKRQVEKKLLKEYYSDIGFFNENDKYSYNQTIDNNML